MHEYLDRVALAPPITDYYRALDIVDLYQCWTTGVADSKVLRFLLYHFYLILVFGSLDNRRQKSAN